MNPTYKIKGLIKPYPIATLHELLEQQALTNPEAIALEFNEAKVSYGVLQKRINKTAHYLYDIGIRPGHIIAISLDRTPDLIVAMFAVLQCGAAYVPIDTGYPKKRLDLIMADSNASYIISNSSKNSISDNSKNICIENIEEGLNKFPSKSLNLNVDPKSVAYIIYTSGSTGTPKGVQVSHLNTINLLFSMGEEPGISKDDKIFAVTTISFDAMVMETFLPLIHGASIVLVDEETRLDGQILLEKAQKDKITMMWGTPSIWQILLDSDWKKPLKIKALIGGEPVPLNLAHKLLDLCDELWNIYGPTETTVCAFLTKISKDDDPITIGKPIANTHAYLLDEKGNHVTYGNIGEIAIGGDGVSLGYLNKPELTNTSFIEDPFSPNTKMYLSGDLGKLLPNGQMQCLGRRDQQVKIRGHRIELGEIEKVIDTLPNIKKNAVVVSNLIAGQPRLVAYLQSNEPHKDTNTLRNHLEDILPDFMIPSIFMWINEFPITPNGKIDKKNLPQPQYVRPDSAPMLKKPRTKLEKNMVSIWSEYLQIPVIGIDDNFFELGGTSLLTQKVATAMRQRFNLKVPVTKLYEYPTIAALSGFIEGNQKPASFIDYSQPRENKTAKEVAIIGISGRFPGANSIDELWNVLKNGIETISFFTSEELDKTIPESLRNNPLYVKARGIVPSAKEFDAKFFELNPKLAEAMDPQHRLFLEIAYEALEQSGHLPKHYNGSIGVYAGTGTNTYFINNVLPNQELLNQVGMLQVNTVNEKDYIASRVAYHLNLKGPAVSVHSGCSTSLLAIAEAVEAIRNNQCDVALAGGSSLTAPIFSGHLYQEGSMLSSDGHCRSFDANAKGTVFSDGAGVILLKSLENAKKDGDFIYGIIKGIGISNDGGGKGSFTAPSTEGQSNAISKAIQDAQILPSKISYVETHGTATPIGDPIEMEGLIKAFGPQNKKGFCAIGSIKSNMGHLTAAAGVAGVIKTTLALHHKKIPPSIGYDSPNPAIDFNNSPFFVANSLRDWHTDSRRCAGVSSFGVGGTNVHVIVEEYEMEPASTSASRPTQLLTWSAKTENSLSAYQTALGNFIHKSTHTPLADIAYALRVTREDFSHRSFLIAESHSEAAKNLITPESRAPKSHTIKVVPNDIGFLFPGQGSQYLQMGKTLYDNEIVYREAIDRCAELLMADLKLDIRDIIFPETNSNEAEKSLRNTFYTQPALFVTEYALAQLWMSWGIKPTLLCGHSVGEFVAAHLAGVFNLKDALKVIASRSLLISELPGGSMLSVRLPEAGLKELLPNTLSIAAVNSTQLCVVAGKHEDIETFAKLMASQDIPNKILFTSHAFHSSMMNPMLEHFEETLKQVTLNNPSLPIVSTSTGTWLTNNEATSIDYWVRHVKNTVRFADAVNTIMELEDCILLEVGPGNSLTTLAQQQAAGKIIAAFPSLALPKADVHNEYETILNALGNLWIRGINPDFQAFYKDEQRERINLPSYVFDRKPCWAEPIMNKTSYESNYTESTEIKKPIESTRVTSINPMENEAQRTNSILLKLLEIISNISGITYDSHVASNSFLELGLDSLTLTQLSLKLQEAFNLPITFRKLNEELATPHMLADYIKNKLPKTLETKDNTGISESISLKQEPVNTNHETAKYVNKVQDQVNKTNAHQTGHTNALNKPPMPGARLGRDDRGNPVWYIADPNEKGKFIKVDL